MRSWRANLVGLWVLAAAATVGAQTGVKTVEVGAMNSREAGLSADRAMRDFTRRAFDLSAGVRRSLGRGKRYHAQVPFSLPGVVRLSNRGRVLLGGRGARSRGAGIDLAFDVSGPRAFPASYQQQLVDVFTEAETYLDLVFGAPSLGGTVHVRNYDADIGDRHAVSGGYFVPDNGMSEPEIRFPIFNNPEAAAVNFVHCLLLAYLGPNAYGFDAFQEGLARAATMRIVRISDAMPANLDPGQIEAVLENLYDVGPAYDWLNQRPLGGARFIAPNLLEVPLPAGGSLGGIYLIRYQMAGTAWQKVLAQHPGFIAAFNQQFYSNPGLSGDVPGLAMLAQAVLDSLAGAGATVEGRSFAEWFRRQFALETRDTLGPKQFILPTPIEPFGAPDFGVFDVASVYFETRLGGDEILLSGVCFPIFWTDTFDRLFPDAQSELMSIAGAYGSVTPNLPDLHSGKPYRCTVDLPVQDRMARAFLPAGAIATAENPTPNDFYGTVAGVQGGSGVTVRIRLTQGSTVIDDIAVEFGAFGTRIATSQYLGYGQLRVEVIRRQNSLDTVVIDRLVNKGPGPLGLDLRLGNGESTFAPLGGLPKGLSTLGLPIDPFASLVGAVLGIPEAQVLAARWNGSKARYDIYPDCGPMLQGGGFFVRMDAAQPGFAYAGRSVSGVPGAVALRPGWNFVACPLLETVPTSRVQVVRAAEIPDSYGQAIGTSIGAEFFEFLPGANDAATGAPETGTMVPASSFVPGKAYYVRTLAAEGVSLVFQPASQATSLAASSASRGSAPQPTWLMRVAVADGPRQTWVQIGQSFSASYGFDPAEDSGLPPSFGGMQLTVLGPERMFRDVRFYRRPTVYRMRLEGLRPGRTYTLRTSFERGGLRLYSLRDVARTLPTWHVGPAAYTFRATSTERAFEVQVVPRSW